MYKRFQPAPLIVFFSLITLLQRIVRGRLHRATSGRDYGCARGVVPPNDVLNMQPRILHWRARYRQAYVQLGYRQATAGRTYPKHRLQGGCLHEKLFRTTSECPLQWGKKQELAQATFNYGDTETERDCSADKRSTRTPNCEGCWSSANGEIKLL